MSPDRRQLSTDQPAGLSLCSSQYKPLKSIRDYRAELAKNCPRGGSAGRVRKVPPGEPVRSTASLRGRARVSPAAATAR